MEQTKPDSGAQNLPWYVVSDSRIF